MKLSFLGDLMCLKAQNVASIRKYGKLYFDDQFAPCFDEFKNSNYVIGNLETPICPSKELTKYDIRFNSSIEYLKAIYNLGVDFVSLANNHVLDQGIDGLNETIGCVKKLGFEYSGAYQSFDESHLISSKDINGVKISLICFTFGTNSQVNGIFLSKDELWRVDLMNKQKKMLQHWEPNPNAVCEKYIADETSIAAITNPMNDIFRNHIKEKIQEAKRSSDIVIALPHMGGQYNPCPGYYARWMMNFFKNSGADIVIAGHPHVPQKCSWNDDFFSCYSLGNFACTPYIGWNLSNSLSEYGMILHLDIDEASKKIQSAYATFVKNLVDEYGYTTTHPVLSLYKKSSTIERERLEIDIEELVNRLHPCSEFDWSSGRCELCKY